MPFPDEAIDARVELRVGETWTDITGHVYTRDPITITGGRTAEGSRPDPGGCSLTLNNADGRYSPRNPLSPYYGLIGRNTPLRVSVPGRTEVIVPGGVADRVVAAGSETLNITGDIDIAVEMSDAQWHLGGMILSKRTATGDQRSWMLNVRDSGELLFVWYHLGTVASQHFIYSTTSLVEKSGRQAVRVTVDIAAHIVTFFTGPSIDGPWTQLGNQRGPFAGSFPVFASTAPIVLGAEPSYDDVTFAATYHAWRVLDGIGGTPLIDVRMDDLSGSGSSFIDGTGRTWNLEGNALVTDRDYRFVGEVPSWPPQWDTSGTNVWVPIEAAGITRRLGQGAKPLQSALRRSIADADPYPVWWPMEDSPGALQAASGYPDMAGLRLTGGPTFTGEESQGLGGGAEFSATTKSASGAVPEALAEWVVAFWLDLPALSGQEDAYTGSPYIHWECPSAAGAYAWDAYAAGNPFTGHEIFVIDVFDAAGGIHFQLQSTRDIWGQGPLQFVVHARQTAGGIITNVYIDGVFANAAATFEGDLLKPIGPVGVNTARFTLAAEFEGVVSHLLVAPGSRLDEVTGHVTAGHGHVGETAGSRIIRLCEEEGIPVTVVGDPATTAPMGVQQQATFLDLLGEAAEADGGTLGERRDLLALSYRTRTADYNEPPALTLDYHDQVAAPLEPVEDDQALRNDVTVERQGGSSARVVREDGPLSVAPPPDGVGLYDESVTLNVAEDGQLLDQAGWRVHLGTVDEARYPIVRLKLHKHPDLIDDALALHLRSRIRLTGLPAWMPPGDVDLLIDGYTEVIEPLRWTMEWNTVPGSPWQVGTVDDDVYGRADTDGSHLLTAVDADDTTLLVATPDGPYWTTDPAEFPFDLAVGGEVLTAAAAADGLSDGFDRTVADGFGTTPDGQAWTVIGTATEYSVGTSMASMRIASRAADRIAFLDLATEAIDFEVTYRTTTAVTGDGVFFYVLARGDSAALSWYALRIGMHPDGTTRLAIETGLPSFILLSGDRTIPGVTPTANAWKRARMRVQGGRIDGKVWNDGSPEPLDWQNTAFSELYATGKPGLRVFVPGSNTSTLPFNIQFREIAFRNPQKLTVARATNGIAKAHAVGADIRLAQPMIVAL